MKSNDGGSKTIRISFYGNTKELGRILNHYGVTNIIYSINEGPKRYKEISAETELPNSTLERCLKELEIIQIIKKTPIASKNRETHQYHFTPIGKEFLKFITSFEKIIRLPESQQKIIKIEK